MNGPLPPAGGPPSMRASGLPPSPPISIGARSSNSGGAYAKQAAETPMPASPLPPGVGGGPPGPGGPRGPGPRKYDPRALEAQLAEHHRVLKDYLAHSLREDNTYIPHNRARDKLLRLSAIQFQELSTDVYDELLRREDERYARSPDGSAMNVPRFLLPRNNFHPKRNQARQKLSTLAAKKFRELATDVLFELERRFPRFTGAERLAARGGSSRPGTSMGMSPPPLGPGMRRTSNASSMGPYSPSLVDGRPYQGNSMVPNKSMMVEDDDDNSGDDDDPYDLERAAARSSRRTTNKSLSMHPLAGEYQNQISELEAKIAEMESQVQEKEKAVEAERERSSVLTENLERQLKSVETLNGSLQGEIDRLKVDSSTDDWRARYESLEQEFHEHRQVSEDVRHSANQSLREMRALVMEVNQRSEHEERLVNRISTLEAQVEDWKSRHAKTNAHLRTLRASSMGVFIEQPTAPQFASENSLMSSTGLIRDTSVTRFQMAIDELLQLSRGDHPDQVLPFMRKVVAGVRSMTADVNKAGAQSASDDSAMRRKKLEAQIAAASNNLISVAKNHTLSQGLAPVSLIDAATSHLTLAVIELIKYVKVRPTSEAALESHDDEDNFD